MRIRSIKPEFWRSDDIDALDWETRLVFIGLWSYVDDNGVGVYKMPNIVSDLFASDFYRDPTATLSRVSEALKRLESRSMIDLYRVGERDYLYITNWERHQRVNNPNKPRYPLPTSENVEPIEGLSRSDAGSGEALSPGTGEQGNRGTGEQPSSSAKPPAVAKPPREDVEALCTRLRDHIAGNTSKTPNITAKWRTEARLLLDRDDIPFDEAVRVLDWSQADSFWKGNILSMPKFREKFAQLQIKSRQSSGRGNTNDDWSTPKGYDPADWLRKDNEPAFDYIDAEVVQLREIGR